MARRHRLIMPPAGRIPGMAPVSPLLARTGTYPFVRLEQAKREVQAARHRDGRLRRRRSARARRPADRAGASRRAAGGVRLPAGRGAPRAAGGDCRLVPRRRFGVALDPDPEIIPTFGRRRRSSASRRSSSIATATATPSIVTEPGYPVPERGALFAGAHVVRSSRSRGARLPSDLDAVDPELEPRRCLGQLPEQPDGVTAPLLASTSSSPNSRRARLPARLRRGVQRALVRRAARLGPRGRRRGNVVVFNTLSKRSSMTGYRSGFVAADAER